jgi:hypothetical protein
MKKRIALGAAMLLTLGTAVAGTFLYGHEHTTRVGQMAEQQITLPSDNQSGVSSVTPEQIAMWKATAASTDYEAPKAPI